MADYAYYILSGSAAGAVIAAFALGLLITHQGLIVRFCIADGLFIRSAVTGPNH